MSPKPLLLHPKWISGSTSLLTRREGAGQHYQVAVCLALAAAGLRNAVQPGSAQGCWCSKPTVLTAWGKREGVSAGAFVGNEAWAVGSAALLCLLCCLVTNQILEPVGQIQLSPQNNTPAVFLNASRGFREVGRAASAACRGWEMLCPAQSCD